MPSSLRLTLLRKNSRTRARNSLNYLNTSAYSYDKYSLHLHRLCQIYHLPLEIIGYEPFEKIKTPHPLFRFSLNPHSKLNFVIVSGLHGDEIAGPLTLLQLIKDQDKYTRRKIRYSIYPLMNPTGFELWQRKDDDTRDLNTLNKTTLKSKNYREIQAFFHHIKNTKIHTFLDLHEDDDEKRFYAYAFEKQPQAIYKKVIQSAARHCRIWRAKSIYTCPSDGQGLIINHHDQSLEDYLFSAGRARISLCTETPGKLPLTTRIQINLETIKILSDSVLSQEE